MIEQRTGWDVRHRAPRASGAGSRPAGALRRGGRSILFAAALFALAGCSATGPAPAAAPDATPAGELTVYAAASLADVFGSLADPFEAAHPGAHVRFAFGGSSGLAAQLEEGARADVFAAADERTMDRIEDLLAGAPTVFATNTLEIAVPPGNPAAVAGLADLAAPGVRVVVCAPQVPCGAAAARAAGAAGVALSPVSEEQSVTDVLAKVASGDADAGLVYATDVLAAGDAVQGVPFPEAARAVNRYPIAVLADAPETALAGAWTAFVLGPEGRAALADAGFGLP